MARLFLSYARDNVAIAERLVRSLSSVGHDVWYDKRLTPGSAFNDEIEQAIAQCDHVLVLWTDQSVASSWVRDEATVGREAGKLVPLRLGGTSPPMGFRQLHTIDIDDWDLDGMLPQTLTAAIGGSSTSSIGGAEQTVRFATADDGTTLAWSAIGNGPPILKMSNWLNHLEFEWSHPMWRHWIATLSDGHQLIRYDQRGNGMSDWKVPPPTVDRLVDDVRTVADAAGIDRFDIFAMSQGTFFAVPFAVRYPERVRRIVIVNGFAAGWEHHPKAEVRDRWEAMITLIRTGWGQDNPVFRQMFTSLFFPQATPAQAQAWNELQKLSASPTSAEQTLRMLGAADVRDLLGQVRAPTLVLHARGDQMIPYEAGRKVAASIPGARFVAVDSENHLMLNSEPAWPFVQRTIAEFLADD